MDVSTVSASQLSEVQMLAALKVQRQAMDIVANNVAQLIEALPTPAPVPGSNSTVGRSIDIFV
ncbi:MAG: YjfB family protein [Rhodocyclaceae bacterium]